MSNKETGGSICSMAVPPLPARLGALVLTPVGCWESNLLANKFPKSNHLQYFSRAEEIMLLLCVSYRGPERARPNHSQQEIANLHAPDRDWASWGEEEELL